jgi:hypothetical protein
MRRLGHYIPVILGIVMVLGALFLTGGFFAAPLAEFEETTFHPPLEVTSSMAPTGLSYKKVPIVTDTDVPRSRDKIDILPFR